MAPELGVPLRLPGEYRNIFANFAFKNRITVLLSVIMISFNMLEWSKNSEVQLLISFV